MWGNRQFNRGMEMLTEILLRDRFTVWGKFEEVTVVNNLVYMLAEARIFRRSAANSLDTEKRRANAVMVIFNPGNCKPIAGTQVGDWTEAKPDKTQFQLMRLMERMIWDEVVIVNLSDFCEGNAEKLNALVNGYEHAGKVYSRFANDPVSEWINVISSADRLLYGWGAKPLAKEMADAYRLLDDDYMFTTYGKKPEAVWHSVKGYPKHPNPQFPVKCAEWLEEMEGVLNGID